MPPIPSIVIFCCILALAQGRPDGRIVGGVDAKEGQFPHQISLRRNGRHICGGSIISYNFIVTAAHCVTEIKHGETTPLNPKECTVVAGTTNRLEDGHLLQVASIRVHENYVDVLNDIALLKLKKPLNSSEKIQPIPLASSETPDGSSVFISGWGLSRDNGEIPVKLQWTNLTSISIKKCALRTGIFTNKIICLAHDRDNGACNGDLGGPAVFNDELVGVANFVVGGCGTSKPDGYARVFTHLDWIKNNSDLNN